ncbi:MAG: CoA transferase [Actinomycetia bacterium]|nr:CoA transferase [Actinomycetes bacterium]
MILDQSVHNHDDMRKRTDDMLREVGLTVGDSGGTVSFAGAEPVRKTVMKAGAAPAIILAANAVAEAAIWRERTGEGQDIHVDLRKAWIEQSPWQPDAARYTLVNGVSKMFNFGAYVVMNPQCPTRDGRFMIMCPIYPSQERKILRLLNCGPDESQLRAAIIKRDALEMEAAAEASQLPLQMIRTLAEWDASEQGQISNATPLISIKKIGESDPIPLPQGQRPLSGLRVLSMVHAVAGPCCPRTLAGQGADCLNLNMPDWIEYGNFFYQSEVGVRQAYLDARKTENRPLVYALLKDADVFVENLRPGLADQEGYSAESLAERKPGIISVSVKLNARMGPWSHWPGFDINAYGITGLATAEGTPDQPLPPQQVNVICDIMTGYLGAIGVKAALLRRAKEGGSYRVDVSLAQCCRFISSLGLNDKESLDNLASLGEDHQIVKPNLITGMTAFGEFTKAASQVDGMTTPQYWEDPLLRVPGSDKPEWIST